MSRTFTTPVKVACNICSSPESTPVTVQNTCALVRCVDCGFVYVNPRPADSAYKDLYVDYLPDRMDDPFAWKRYMAEVFTKTADMIETARPEKGSSLDIGCGFGFFVEEMKERGWKASGIDISAKAVGFASDRGLDVRLGSIDAPGVAEGSFDAITMFYVLEHLPDPLASLKKVRSLLKPGGVLVIRIPHTTPIVRLLTIIGIKNNLYDPPFHLSDFSPACTRKILEKAGFTGIDQVIGGATLPENTGPRLVSRVSNFVADILLYLSGARVLLPGVSKTTLARRPLS